MDDTANSHVFQVKIEKKKQHNFFKIQFSLHVVENNQHEDKKKMSTQIIKNLCWTQATCHEFEFCNFLLSEFCGYRLYISILRFSWFMIIVCINVCSCLSCVSMLCLASMC